MQTKPFMVESEVLYDTDIPVQKHHPFTYAH